jgi:hypothetical protein
VRSVTSPQSFVEEYRARIIDYRYIPGTQGAEIVIMLRVDIVLALIELVF